MSTSIKKAIGGAAVAALLVVCALLGTGVFKSQDAYADGTATPLTLTANTAGSTVSLGWYEVGTGGVQYKASSTSVTIGGSAASTEWANYSKDVTITLTNAGDSVSFKADQIHTSVESSMTYGYGHFKMAGSISASGDVTSLTNGEGGDAALASECYAHMFDGCTVLTTAPNLPSAQLAQSCYAYMFAGCTSLTTAPALPATQMQYACYASMFAGCSALATAPELPSTQLAESCYMNMFQSCTQLTTAPALPATTLPTTCYNYMFWKCTALTEPAFMSAVTTLAVDYGSATGCCECMYKECTALYVYTTATSGYYRAWKATSATDASNSGNWSKNMFAGAGGDVTGVNDVTAGTTYYIKDGNPTASNFTFTAPTDLTADGTSKGVTIAPQTGLTGIGTVTVYYSGDNGNNWGTTAPTEAGTYIVKADVAAGDTNSGWGAATDLRDTSWTYTLTAASSNNQGQNSGQNSNQNSGQSSDQNSGQNSNQNSNSGTTDSDSSSNSGSSSSTDSDQTADSTIVKTGDATPVVPIVVMVAVAFAGLIIARKRMA